MLAEVAKVLMTTRPTQTSVLESLEECHRLGDEAFHEKYASGHQPLGHYLIHEDKRYPMKAVWAAAHRPTIHTRDFKTGAARRGTRGGDQGGHRRAANLRLPACPRHPQAPSAGRWLKAIQSQAGLPGYEGARPPARSPCRRHRAAP